MSTPPPVRDPWQEPWLRTILRCPLEAGDLDDVVLPDGTAALACRVPHEGADGRPVRVAYPVRDGIPVLLIDDAVPLT